jgi:hypothetical protein
LITHGDSGRTFALSPVASLAQPATATPTLMMLGYFYRPYTANALMGRLTVLR